VIDESTAMALAQPDPVLRRRGFVLTAVGILVCWNLGTLAGALAGGELGDPKALGMDAIFPAVFLALLVPQVRTRGALAAAVVGAAIAIALLPDAPAGVPVMASAVAALPLILRGRRS
jgi:predicted branched-subunit amino acid permease